MCLSERSELRHIDPKARIERWDNLNRLSKRSELRHIDPKAQTERWDILDSLSKPARVQLNSLE